MTTDKSSEREAFVYWWRHKYSAADLEGIPEHVALNAAWAAWQARAALPQQAQEALTRLWPLFERATKDLVFTADRAGEVMADMNTLRAAIAKGERHE